MASSYDDIVRDGFACGFGRFYAKGRVERVDGLRLKAMFLPRLTPEANKLIRDHYGSGFVRGQLQHYGVDYDERELSGNGTMLMKKALQAGKCDKVPVHIEELRSQMHAEWLEKLPEEELAGHPEWIMEKYFVDGSGKAEPTKTAEVIGIPYPYSSDYRTGQLREAASRVRGLYHATGWGSTQTIYLGWDQDAVTDAAKKHGAKEAQANRAKADARQEERASKHKGYLANAEEHKRGPGAASPVGQYSIDCEEIEDQWPQQSANMKLAIHTTPTPGIYQASFDFGIIEGMMMISCDEGLLDRFCAQQEHDDDSGSDDGDSDSDDDDSDSDDDDSDSDESAENKTAVGSKRKATASKATASKATASKATASKATASKATNTGGRPRGRPPKKAKAAGASKPTKYFLRLKCRETGTGEIHPRADKGTIKFGGQDLSSFTGDASLSCIGQGVIFKARKISAVPSNLRDSWDNYSEAAYERARVGRWGSRWR